MPLDPSIKDSWTKLQEQYDYPVDALGRPIDQNDKDTLRVWQDEGIDQFMQR
jgi:hypothetical protein